MVRVNDVLTFLVGIVKNSFFLGVCSSLIAAALFPHITEIASSVLAKLFGWLPVQGKTDLSNCTWQTTFEVESDRFPKKVTDEEVKIRQFGNRVFIKFKTASLDFIARGVIDSGRYVTGTWQDKIQGGYHGAFQLIIDPVTRDMSGRWIGYSTQGVVKQGLWIWIRNIPNSNHPREVSIK
jgi:hypothetical protein